MKSEFKPDLFLLDVDGVLTDGKIYYGENGKQFKVFGADDHEALIEVGKFLEVRVVTADFRGYKITSRRVIEDMHLKLDLISADERPDWVKSSFGDRNVVYMGDGIKDWKVFSEVAYGIAPANAYSKTFLSADFVTVRRGAEGAVSEACEHIISKYFFE